MTGTVAITVLPKVSVDVMRTVVAAVGVKGPLLVMVVLGTATVTLKVTPLTTVTMVVVLMEVGKVVVGDVVVVVLVDVLVEVVVEDVVVDDVVVAAPVWTMYRTSSR